MTEENNTEAEVEEEKKPENLVNAYRDRLKVLKQAQEYAAKGDIPKSVERYSAYLSTLAAYFRVDENNLSPKLFDAEKDITELLLISHAYWDLSKAYDRSPKLHNESIRCLEQFIKFSTGFKFQHVNAQMIKKYIKQKQAHNIRPFLNAYQRLKVDTKACYIATHCYGSEDEVTNTLRIFRDKIVTSTIGFKAIELYYDLSPSLIKFITKLGLSGRLITKYILRPIVFSIYKLIKPITK